MTVEVHYILYTKLESFKVKVSWLGILYPDSVISAGQSVRMFLIW
jgi:hypothetical protein